jgi:hypothetical protein
MQRHSHSYLQVSTPFVGGLTLLFRGNFRSAGDFDVLISDKGIALDYRTTAKAKII